VKEEPIDILLKGKKPMTNSRKPSINFFLVAVSAMMVASPAFTQTCVSPPAGLVSWWAGETDVTDRAGTNNGSFTGTPSFSTGEAGQGFSFLGDGNYVQVPDNPTLSFTSDFSIEFWYKDTGMPGGAYGGLVAKRPPDIVNAPCNFGLTLIGGNPSTFLVYLLDSNIGAYQSLTYSGLPSAGSFHHLAVTFRQAPAEQVEMTAYVDGQPVATNSVPGSLARTTNNAPLTIGASNSNGEFFKGLIDEVSIYNRLLSASEVAAVYSAGSSGKCLNTPPVISVQPSDHSVFQGTTVSLSVGATGAQPLSFQWIKDGSPLVDATNAVLTFTNVQVGQSGTYAVGVTNLLGGTLSSNAVLTVTVAPPCAPPPAGLVSWWPAEGDTYDIIGTNNGAVVNGVGFSTAKVGQGFSLNGAGAFVQVPDNPSLSFSNDFSIELWYKDAGLQPGQYGALIAKRLPSGACNYGVTIIGGTPGTLLVYYLDPQHGGYQALTYSGVPAAGGFHHLGTTFHQLPSDQLQLKAYIDGQLVQTATLPGTLARTVDSSPVYIGSSSPNGEFFKGIIDEVSIYGGLLSDSAMASIYQSGAGGKCAGPTPAHIFQQPADQIVVLGQTATITVGGAGSSPLSYQWSFNGTPVLGATDASLVLTNVQMSQAGLYSVVVTNAYGSAPSTNANLSVVFPPATIQVAGTSGTAGQLLTVPLVLLANGNENAVGFSLNFSPTQLTNVGVTLGTGAAGGSLQFNSGSPGKVGVAVALPSGTTFAPGTQEVAEVSFIPAVSTHAYTVTLSFGDQPTKRELADAKAQPLAANFTSGQVTLARSSFEADVAPRPDGDGTVSVVDWVQVGRYVAALDTPTNASEFQRADCAPRSVSGDGQMTVSDWVQAGRYAAGLDPLTLAAGPTSPPTGNVVALANRKGSQPLTVVTVQGPLLFKGQTATALVNLQAQGGENALGLSLSFDPTVVSYTGTLLGSDATSAAMDVNTNQAPNGQLGIILALPTNASFSPGTRQLLKVSFQALTATSIDSVVALTDSPVHLEVADTNALPVAATYSNGVISVNPKPSLAVAQTQQTLSLAWPAWATNYTLQQAAGITPPTGSWTNVTATPVVKNNSFGVTLPLSGSSQFYRLQHQ
jgi:hypothetical protein